VFFEAVAPAGVVGKDEVGEVFGDVTLEFGLGDGFLVDFYFEAIAFSSGFGVYFDNSIAADVAQFVGEGGWVVEF
jgi:hypothetical protein